MSEKASAGGRRRFIVMAGLGSLALPACVNVEMRSSRGSGPVLLTVSGSVGDGNRGPRDPALDQLMVKQEVDFDRAHTFDFASIRRLSTVTIEPTLEYDAERHTLEGPLLTDVLQAAGATPEGDDSIILRAIDGYTVALPVEDARRLGFIIATHIDGEPMALGGLGPLWAVFEPDRFPETTELPLEQRFVRCPWGLYHIEVLGAPRSARTL